MWNILLSSDLLLLAYSNTYLQEVICSRSRILISSSSFLFYPRSSLNYKIHYSDGCFYGWLDPSQISHQFIGRYNYFKVGYFSIQAWQRHPILTRECMIVRFITIRESGKKSVKSVIYCRIFRFFDFSLFITCSDFICQRGDASIFIADSFKLLELLIAMLLGNQSQISITTTSDFRETSGIDI